MTIRRLLTAILFIAIFTMAVRIPADTDTWWHLRAGQFMVEQQTILTTDPFSHTRLGQEWIDHGWLAQIGWYGVFALGGWPGLSLSLAALVTISFWLVWQVTPGNPFIRAFATLVGAITSAVIWMARPQMVSFALAALTLFILERYKRGRTDFSPSHFSPLYALPFIIIVWANIHGGYAIAFMIIAAYIAGESFNHFTGHTADPVLSWGQIGRLLAVAGISFVLVALNPHGWEMWVYPFRTVGIGVLRDFIQEWRSPDFHQMMTWPFVGMWLLTLTAISQAGRRVDWSDLALIGLWTVWSLFAGRNIGLYGLLTVPALARYLDAAGGHYLPSGERGLASRRPFLRRLNGALLGVIIVAALIKIGVALSPQARQDHFEATLPVNAVDFIQQHRPAGPMFNSYNWGGYLIYELWPDYLVYVDGRTDLYDDEFLRQYFQIMVAGEDWQENLAQTGANLVFIETNSTLAKFLRLDPAWQELYHDDLAAIFQRH